MLKTVFLKQWQDVKARIWTYPLVALLLTLYWHEGNLYIMVMAGSVLLADLAIQLAGDDARNGTFEFIFTRPINRTWYLSVKFLFGFLVFLSFIALYAVFETADVRALFWTFVSEPVESFPFAEGIGATHFLLGALFLLLVYTVNFFLCSTSTGENSHLPYCIAGILLSAVYFVLSVFLLRIALFQNEARNLLQGNLDLSLVLNLAAFLLIPVLILFFISTKRYGRCELPSAVPTAKDSHWMLWLMVIFFVILMAASFALLLTPVGVSGG